MKNTNILSALQIAKSKGTLNPGIEKFAYFSKDEVYLGISPEYSIPLVNLEEKWGEILVDFKRYAFKIYGSDYSTYTFWLKWLEQSADTELSVLDLEAKALIKHLPSSGKKLIALYFRRHGISSNQLENISKFYHQGYAEPTRTLFLAATDDAESVQIFTEKGSKNTRYFIQNNKLYVTITEKIRLKSALNRDNYFTDPLPIQLTLEVTSSGYKLINYEGSSLLYDLILTAQNSELTKQILSKILDEKSIRQASFPASLEKNRQLFNKAKKSLASVLGKITDPDLKGSLNIKYFDFILKNADKIANISDLNLSGFTETLQMMVDFLKNPTDENYPAVNHARRYYDLLVKNELDKFNTKVRPEKVVGEDVISTEVKLESKYDVSQKTIDSIQFIYLHAISTAPQHLQFRCRVG